MTAAAQEQPSPADELDALTMKSAVGRGLALSLATLADRARAAEHEARAASWEDPQAIAERLAAARAADRLPSLDADGDTHGLIPTPAGPHVERDSLNPAAAAAASEAVTKVMAAFDAVAEAREAVLAAQLASAEQQVAEGKRTNQRSVRVPRTLSAQGGAMWAGVRSEYRYLVARKPRKVLRALAIALLGAIAYMVWIRLFSWNTYGKWAPYLAVLFISSVMGTSACFNSIAFDAQRVRVALDSGARLWQILVVKNLALMALVLPLGVAMCVALAILTGSPATLLAAIALVLSILLLWSGVGNLLSVVLPIRDAPLKVHRQSGTLRQFLLEFAVTWAISYLVLFLLIWRVYSAKGMGERYDSTVIAVVLLLVSAAFGWINLTVMAVAFANVPSVHRRLRRELDWGPDEVSTSSASPAILPAGPAGPTDS
jgi:hypothetical protein